MGLLLKLLPLLYTVCYISKLTTSYTLNKTDVILTCPEYGEIENAIIELLPNENILTFEVLHIGCEIGYELVPKILKVVCVHGVWEPSERPKCTSRCLPPPYLHNGLLRVEGTKDGHGKFEKGALAIYTCKKDYMLSPPESKLRVCEMGNWTGMQGFCVSTMQFSCKRPKDILNGYFVLEKGDLENSYDIGQRLHYSCNPGYVLTGPAMQQCLDDGSWSPRIPPTCVKMDDEDHRCGPAPIGEYTTSKEVRGARMNGRALLGTELEVRCLRGYHDEHAKCRPTLLRCVAPGIWKGTPPACVPVNSCGSPPSIENGAMFNYGGGSVELSDRNGDSVDVDTGDDENNEIDGLDDGLPARYRVGAQVAYKCLPGYQIRGDFILTCFETGCWHPNSPPACYPDRQYLEDYMNARSMVWVVVAMMGGLMVVFVGIFAVALCRRRRTGFQTDRRGGSGGPTVSRPPLTPADCTRAAATALLHDPDRLALIAYADGMQSGLPSYEEAVRERGGGGGGGGGVGGGAGGGGAGGGGGVGSLLSCRPHRTHWAAVGSARRSRGQSAADMVTRQTSCSSHSQGLRAGSGCGVGGDPMGSTDTMTPSEVSTNITLDTVSSHTCSSGSQVASCRAICGSLASFDTSSVHNTEGVPLLEESEQEEAPISLPAGGLVVDHQNMVVPGADNASFKFRHTSPDLA